jgi:pimeloyl-ACP methyl ester carboxylesterase
VRQEKKVTIVTNGVKKFMNSFIKLIACMLFCFAINIPIAGNISLVFAQEQPGLEQIIGIWQGTLKVPGTELKVDFKISKAEDGSLKATMDSPDQGAYDIPTSKVIFQNDSLKIDASSIGGMYLGKFDKDSLTIAGQWQQNGMTFPLNLKQIKEEPRVNRPQEPKKPYPYIEEEVSYQNKQAGITLAGTLTLPDSVGKFPAVILITGSGAQDRNETIFGHRPFLVLADYLTRRGIAVLRVDDRGVGGSTGDFSTATTKDFASDVLAGIAYLKTRKEIDSKKIGLIGHSEGGMIAPMVAAQSKDVAFIVLMAGTGLTGEEILYMQAALIAKADGASDSAIAQNRLTQEKIFTVLKQEKNDSVAVRKLRKIMTDELDHMSEQQKQELGPPENYINAQIKQLMSPWFRFFLTYNPKPTLMKVKCPVLAIGGELDLQVPAKENLTAIEQALKAGGNNHVTIKILPKLNHLFQTATTGSPSEYGKIEETISPVALKYIGDWILEQVAK